MTALDAVAGPQLVPVACPRCGGTRAEPRYRLVRSSIVTCHGCGLSYVTPRMASAHLEEKLQAWADQDVVDAQRLGEAFSPGNLEHYARLLRLLARHAPCGRRLLDVGCSTGAFLTVARDAGWEVKGVEIGAASARHAREALGLDVTRGSLYGYGAAPGTFDAVAFLEVIEHLERPAEALDRIRELLVPGGLLLLTTPNFDSLYRRLFGSNWWVVNCEDEHIVLFNRQTLSGLLRERGFEVLEARNRGLDFHGMLREARRSRAGAPVAAPVELAAAGYYESRERRARLKRVLQRVGVLPAAKAALRGLDATFSWRASPTRGWGEQLIFVARVSAGSR